MIFIHYLFLMAALFEGFGPKRKNSLSLVVRQSMVDEVDRAPVERVLLVT